MVYTEDNIFKETAVDMKRRISWDARKYKEVWLAFCKWIVERFDKGKGVNIINFIRLTWEQDEVEKEMYGNAADKVLRPVWRMSESFERAYNQQCKEKKDKRTPLDDENMEKMEEINFHKIAMRYSNTLTKDVVFSCLREIFTRIGKAMMTGKHVQIFCGVGDFVSRDRKAEFIFDSHYHRHVIRQVNDKLEGSASTFSQSDTPTIVISRAVESVDPDEEAYESRNMRRDILTIEEKRTVDENDDEPEFKTMVRGAKLIVVGERDAMKLEAESEGFSNTAIFNGNPDDETWRYERVKDQAGGERKLTVVKEKLWETIDSLAERETEQEVRNVILGQERLAEATVRMKLEAQAELQQKHKAAPVAQQAALENEARRKAEKKELLSKERDQPFYVALGGPDETAVLKKKKIDQIQMKSVLEEQIAQRLMSSKRDNEQRLSDEQKALRHAEQLFEKSILEEHNKKKTETALLKQEWSKQMQFRSKKAALKRLPDAPITTQIAILNKAVSDVNLKP